jgi:hypothetical protein
MLAAQTGARSHGASHHECQQSPSPLAVARLLVLDQVKRLDGAKGLQQLAALVLSEVVGQAANKHTVRLRARLLAGCRGQGQVSGRGRLAASLLLMLRSCMAAEQGAEQDIAAFPAQQRWRQVLHAYAEQGCVQPAGSFAASGPAHLLPWFRPMAARLRLGLGCDGPRLCAATAL